MLVLTVFLCSCGRKTEVRMAITNLHNGDAKFLEDKIITNVGGILTLYDQNGNLLKNYEEVQANWIDVIPEDGIVVYGNFNHEIGIVKLDMNHNYELLSNEVIMTTENLQIDPTIIKNSDTYYITVTEINGNVNNSDINAENGVYTIHLYKSYDLSQWNFVSDVASCQNNLEDVELGYINNSFYAVYEKEQLDKGNSSVCLAMSTDAEGLCWQEKAELLPPDSDHEPASFEALPNGKWKLYYSCDKDYPGESYMGGKIYYAIYDENFELQKKDKEIPSTTEKGILLYDVKKYDKKEQFLMAKDYLTSCDLVIEEK